MAKQFTLGKQERLKSRKVIEQLFKEGKSFAQYPFRVYFMQGPLQRQPLQFGVGVSTRNFKKAVDRNRVKRLVREAYRLQKYELGEKLEASGKQLYIFFIYTGKELPVYQDVYEKTNHILKKLRDMVDKTT